jgi:hypothetical protein
LVQWKGNSGRGRVKEGDYCDAKNVILSFAGKWMELEN